MIRAALAIPALLVGAVAWGAEVEPIVEHGADNRIGLVILGDGYRAEEQEKMSEDARRLTQWVLHASPFAEHEALFTVRLVHLVSNVSGVGGDVPLDTALRSYLCWGPRLICADTGEALRVAAEAFPEFDQAIVMVNTSLSGGSGGVVTVVSTASNAGETLVHELGHSFGGLADEYDGPYPGYPSCVPELDCPEPNVTLRTTLPEVKWRVWIPQGVPIPTPSRAGYDDVVGLFEGARYHTTGIYRPVELRCAMRAGWGPFCPVCTEALVRQMWAHARPHDAVAPEPGPLTRSACEPLTFSVRTAPIAGITVSWDAESAGGACEKPLLTFPPGALAPGQHRVAALVAVQSDLVRNDPYEQLQELLTWSPEIVPCAQPAGPPPAPLCTGWAVPVTALAGPTSIHERSSVLLDASGSSDPDGDVLQFRWSQLAGPPVALSLEGGGSEARFVAPEVTGDAALRFEVVASDGVLSGEPATAEVIVRDQPNQPPAISLSVPAGADSGETVRITAQGSDPDGDPVVLACEQAGGPAVQLDRAAPAEWTFVAPDVAAESAVELRCTASDGEAEAEARASIAVRPRAPDAAPPSSSGRGGCGTGGGGGLTAVALALAWFRRLAARPFARLRGR
ncbi:MAG TPA: M64 family metallopeptidase [Anaeromyxobacter sp.]|nr:M64 family metallopeptidase [Anaeromyxobacter sp.]